MSTETKPIERKGWLDEERLQSVLRPLSGRLTHPWVQERGAVEHRVSFVPSYQIRDTCH